jgi:shikimate dehydrogenase
MSLTPLLTDHHDTALILGDGGAARAVKCVLDNKGITYKCVTRKPAEGNILFSDLKPKHIRDNKLIINTTPVGTYPNVDECPPIPYEAITDDHLLFDLIYNPEETLFLKKGAEQGRRYKKRIRNVSIAGRKGLGDMELKRKTPVRYFALIYICFIVCRLRRQCRFFAKPRGYFRIEFPKKEYQHIQRGLPLYF